MILRVAIAAICLTASVPAATPSLARSGAPPASMTSDLIPLREVDRITMPAVDVELHMREDDEAAAFETGGPARFAVPITVDLTSYRDGTWERRHDGGRIWRLRVLSPGALSLNFGFVRFHLPPGATVHLYPSPEGISADNRAVWYSGPYAAHDTDEEGGFWTAVIPGDETVLEMCVPPDPLFEPELRICQVAHDYRGFAQLVRAAAKQGSCNIDVICAEGDAWRDEIRSVAVYSRGGSLLCTGTLINSHNPQRPPYFLTADHCGVTAQNTRTMVVYWNYQSPVCGALSGGSLDQHQTGAVLVAKSSPTDFCLVRLSEEPDSSFNVYYSGWDAREGTAPQSAVAIHHPACDEKAISFAHTPLSVTSYLFEPVPGDSTHWRVHFWNVGTTEPGSSGSGLWNSDRRLVGQLHGGYASCTSLTSDWYGRLSRSWEGGGTAATRLRDWLDPQGMGGRTIDGRDGSGGDEALAGDANLDGIVNIQDVVVIVNHILDVGQLSEDGFTNADIDRDGGITVFDLVLVINVILETPAPVPGFAHAFRGSFEDPLRREQRPAPSAPDAVEDPLRSEQRSAPSAPDAAGIPQVHVRLVSGEGFGTPGLLITGGEEMAAIQILLDAPPRSLRDRQGSQDPQSPRNPLDSQDPQSPRNPLDSRYPRDSQGSRKQDQSATIRTAAIEGIEGSGWTGQAALLPCGSLRLVLYRLDRERRPITGIVRIPFDLRPEVITWGGAMAASRSGSDMAVEHSGFDSAPPDDSGTGSAQSPVLLGIDPNPFRDDLAVRLYLPVSGRVEMEIFDVTGRLLGARLTGSLPAGTSLVAWRRCSAGLAEAGVYFVRVTWEGRTVGTRSVVLIR